MLVYVECRVCGEGDWYDCEIKELRRYLVGKTSCVFSLHEVLPSMWDNVYVWRK